MSKFRFKYNLLTLALGSAFASSANAYWTDLCPGPTPSRTSADYGVVGIANPLFAAVMGGSGTFGYTAADATPPGCFGSAITGNVRGRIGFGIGAEGTMHTNIDDGMGLTWGFPDGVVGTSAYAIIREDTTSSLFGANGFATLFRGASDTYFYGRTTNGNVQIDLRCDLIADSARLNWTLTNIDTTTSHQIALGFGSTVAPWSETLGQGIGSDLSGSNTGVYVTLPGYKPPKTERRFTKALDPAGYPGSIFFNWSQEVGVGLRVETTASDATTDLNDPTQSQTNTDSFVVGQAFFLLGWPSGGDRTAFPNVIFQEPISDVLFGGDEGYIQFWNPQLVAPAAKRTINAFYRTTWGDSLYGKPYSFTVDTPKVVNLAQGDANSFAQNPFPVRVWVDNNRGFATIDQEIPLQDVQVELLLPAGLTAINAGGSKQTINRIEAREMKSVDFLVQADSFVAGDLTYQCRITPNPGPQKTLTGSIQVVAQPKIILRENANLISSPWLFDSPTWETILGMTPDAEFQAFAWDPVQKGYIVSTGPDRGFSEWIVNKTGTRNLTLQGNPKMPDDFKPTPDNQGGAPLITLKSGWNLIGNPYHVAFQLGEIVGASNANPNSSYTFADLVKQGLISGSFAYWDTGTQNYGFIQKSTDKVEPQRGYWVYVFTSQDVVLRYPPVYQTNVRSTSDTSKPWQQSDKQWRLQIGARSNYSADDQNFIGVTTSADNAKSLRIYEPPMAPLKGALSLGIEKNISGQDTRLAQSLSEVSGRQEFKLKVESTEEGPVTLTWPNLSTIPKNVRVRLIDGTQARDMRKTSGYTFEVTKENVGVTREFTVQIEPGVASKAIIGAVTVSGGTRATGSVRLNYTLGSDATTTVRILGATGREVMTLRSGRADKAGPNEVIWNMKDQANRAVAPGTYRAEIIAEGADGERVRKITPIVITR